jgi:hypothetical protein
MGSDSNEKDERTARLRHQLLCPGLIEETDEAAACTTALSLTSTAHAERHVWVDTDLGGRTSVDLEDRSTEEAWDNAVERFEDLEDAAIVEVVKAWLSGKPLGSIHSLLLKRSDK